MKNAVRTTFFFIFVFQIIGSFSVAALGIESEPSSGTLVVGESKSLRALVPIDSRGDVVVAQSKDGSWRTSLTIEYMGPFPLASVEVERNGVKISAAPGLFLSASAQPMIGKSETAQQFIQSLTQSSNCSLSRVKQIPDATSFDTIESFNACAKGNGLGQVLDFDVEDQKSKFLFEFVKSSPQSVTYEIPVGNLQNEAWVSSNKYACLWPNGWVANQSHSEAQYEVIRQIGGLVGKTLIQVPCEFWALDEMKISIPVPNTMAPLPSPLVPQGSFFSPSTFSHLSPLVKSSTGSSSEIDVALGHVLYTGAVGMVLILLIALPTQLLESTLASNESRIASRIHRLLPMSARKNKPTGTVLNEDNTTYMSQDGDKK